MNYTKGEWTQEGNQINAFGRGIIAICPSPTNNKGVIDFIANANLISAAPEMYMALMAASGTFMALLRDFPDGKHLGIGSRIQEIDEALAKANGK